MDEQRSALARDIKQKRPFKTRAEETAVAILRTADVVRGRLAAVIEPHDITLQQYNVLRILRGAHPDPLPTLEIGERLIERMPGITRLLDRLEEKTLVRRERSAADRRLVHCWITRKGLDVLAMIDPEMDHTDNAIIRELDAPEVDKLLDLLERIRRGAR